MRHKPKKCQSVNINSCKLSQLFRKSNGVASNKLLGHPEAAHPGCRTTWSDVKLSVASFMGFTVQLWQLTRFCKRFWIVSGWRWKVAARANIWLSIKGLSLQSGSKSPLIIHPPPPASSSLFINGRTAATMTFYTVSSLSHHASGDTLAFGVGVLISVCGACWPARLQSCSLSLIISEFINTHLIAAHHRDLNHLHTKIAFFCSTKNAPPLHNY